jgi:hypothetical protein
MTNDEATIEGCEHTNRETEDQADGVIAGGALHVYATICLDCGADITALADEEAADQHADWTEAELREAYGR